MKTVVVAPTYQEADNIREFLEGVRAAVPDADVLVVDDNSPDGTGRIAEEVAAPLGHIEGLHRPQKDGLGAAYRAAFERVLAGDHDVVVQMDCDGSHDPATVPDLLAALDGGADCAIGSRYVPGGSTPNWPLHRRVLSRYGNLYTSALLRLHIRDATSGFRAYRAQVLRDIAVTSTRSTGYAFMSEVAARIVRRGATVAEVPITFVDRTRGTSKMSSRIIVESMTRVTVNGLRSRLRRDGRTEPA